jgi:hypothetical protein
MHTITCTIKDASYQYTYYLSGPLITQSSTKQQVEGCSTQLVQRTTVYIIIVVIVRVVIVTGRLLFLIAVLMTVSSRLINSY